MTDDEFIRVGNAALAWARDFRFPEDWYGSDAMRRRTARLARERVQREIPRMIREATAYRNGGDVARSEAIIAHVREYSQRMQALVVGLVDESAASITARMRELREQLVNVAVSTADGAAAAASSGFSQLLPKILAGVAVALIVRAVMDGGRR